MRQGSAAALKLGAGNRSLTDSPPAPLSGVNIRVLFPPVKVFKKNILNGRQMEKRNGHLTEVSAQIFNLSAIAARRDRFLYGDTTELTAPSPPEHPPNEQKDTRTALYPVCLHLARDRAPQLIAAVHIRNRIDFFEREYSNFDTETFLRKSMHEFCLHDAYEQLLAEADQIVDDYQQATGEAHPPMSRVNEQILLDTLRGDLLVFHFLVYSSIKSYLDIRRSREALPSPKVISVAMIERRLLGFTGITSYRAGYEKLLDVPVKINRWRIRSATLKLARQGLLVRFTLGKFTWYSTRSMLKLRGTKSLEQHALNAKLSNMKKAQQLREHQEQVRQIYKQECAKLAPRTPHARPPGESDRESSPGVIARPVELPANVKLYSRTECEQYQAPPRFRLTRDGVEQFAIVNLNEDYLAAYRSHGYHVERFTT